MQVAARSARRTSRASGSPTSTGRAASRRSASTSSARASWYDAARRAPAAAPAGRRPRAAHGRPVPLRGRGAGHVAVGDRLPRRPHREEHAQVPRQLRRHLGGAQVGARARPRATSRATTSPASPWPRSASTSPTRCTFQQPGLGDPLRDHVPAARHLPAALRRCAPSNGIDPGNIAKMLQGRDSKIMETDRAMWDLADEAKRLGIAELFDREPDQIRGALSAAGGNASIWLTKFDDFLKVYGWRTEGIADINIPSWIEDQSSPLGQIRNFLQRRGAPRLRRRARRLARRAGRGHRGRPVAAERRRPRRLQRAARHLHRRQLRLVERGPQLLHRPPRRRSRCGAARWRSSAAVDADTLRRRARSSSTASCIEVCRGRRASGRTCSRSPPPATSTTTTTRTSGPPSRRSSARCRRRSRTPSSSRSSACTTTTSRRWPPTAPPTC